jgi:hypothetical protein
VLLVATHFDPVAARQARRDLCGSMFTLLVDDDPRQAFAVTPLSG